MITRATLAFLTLIAVGIVTPAATVRYDHDASYDLAGAKSFSWIEKKNPEVPLAHPRIVKAIETQLIAKGMQPAAAGGTLKVTYHLVVRDRTQITDWGYSPGWGRSIDVHQYTEGSIVVDLIDAATDKLVWRGSATDIVSDSPQTNEKRINKGMAKLFKKFPPAAH